MKHIYLILAALMLLCLAPMPYGYFQLVRFVAMVAFGLMAYRYYVINKTVAAVVFGVLALLFQPIYKIVLGRTMWNVVDVLVAVLLIALFVMEKRLERKSKVVDIDVYCFNWNVPFVIKFNSSASTSGKSCSGRGPNTLVCKANTCFVKRILDVWIRNRCC